MSPLSFTELDEGRHRALCGLDLWRKNVFCGDKCEAETFMATIFQGRLLNIKESTVA